MSTSAETRGQVRRYSEVAAVFAVAALAGCGGGGLPGKPTPGNTCQAGIACDAGAGGVSSTGGVPGGNGGSLPVPGTGGAPPSSGGSPPASSTGGKAGRSGGSATVTSTGGAAGSGGIPDSMLDADAFGQKYRFSDSELSGWVQDPSPGSYSVFAGNDLVMAIDGAAAMYVDQGCRVSMEQNLVGSDPQAATAWAFDFVTPAKANAMFKWKKQDLDASTMIPGYDPSVAIGSPSIVAITALAHFNGLYVEVTVIGFGDQTSTCSACPVVAQFLDVLRAKANGGRADAGVDGGTLGLDAGQSPVVKVTPASLDFGQVNVGDMSPAKVVTVTVAPAVALSPTLVGPGFTLDSATTCGMTGMGACTISVKFLPAAVGLASGVLTIAPGSTVALSGMGLVPSASSFTVTPSAIPVTLLVNQSAPVFVTVTTSGFLTDLSCVPSGPDLTADPVPTTCSGMLAAGAPCVYAFNFKAVTAGSKADSIVCSSPSTGLARTVAVTPTVVSPASFSIVPSSVSFSTYYIGTISPPQTLSVANVGGSMSGILTATLTGANADDFAITDNKCVVPLASLATCSIQVTFKPIIAGIKTATIAVTDATPGSVPATAGLIGEGFPYN